MLSRDASRCVATKAADQALETNAQHKGAEAGAVAKRRRREHRESRRVQRGAATTAGAATAAPNNSLSPIYFRNSAAGCSSAKTFVVQEGAIA